MYIVIGGVYFGEVDVVGYVGGIVVDIVDGDVVFWFVWILGFDVIGIGKG